MEAVAKCLSEGEHATCLAGQPFSNLTAWLRRHIESSALLIIITAQQSRCIPALATDSLGESLIITLGCAYFSPAAQGL